METGTTNRSSWASWCWVSQRSAPKLRPEWERMGCEKFAATAVISGKHGTISNLLVLYTSRFIFSYNVSAQRRYLPLKSHWLRSSIHEILFQELSCTSVNAWKSMSFSQWPFRHRMPKSASNGGSECQDLRQDRMQNEGVVFIWRTNEKLIQRIWGLTDMKKPANDGVLTTRFLVSLSPGARSHLSSTSKSHQNPPTLLTIMAGVRPRDTTEGFLSKHWVLP